MNIDDYGKKYNHAWKRNCSNKFQNYNKLRTIKFSKKAGIEKIVKLVFF